MATDDRSIDRKVDTTGDPTNADGPPSEDLRPDWDHFDTFRDGAKGLRDRLRRASIPTMSIRVVAGVMAGLYLFVGVGALSVAYGATSLAAAYGDVHTALIVGGVFTFAYGYAGIRFVDAATQP